MGHVHPTNISKLIMEQLCNNWHKNTYDKFNNIKDYSTEKRKYPKLLYISFMVGYITKRINAIHIILNSIENKTDYNSLLAYFDIKQLLEEKYYVSASDANFSDKGMITEIVELSLSTWVKQSIVSYILPNTKHNMRNENGYYLKKEVIDTMRYLEKYDIPSELAHKHDFDF